MEVAHSEYDFVVPPHSAKGWLEKSSVLLFLSEIHTMPET
jgi:hypothetical protein